MTRRTLLPGLAVVVWCGIVATVATHGGVRAIVTFEPSRPIAGERSAVTVRFVSKTGGAVDLPDSRVRIVADMAGHTMPPVEASLTPDGSVGEFHGEVTFIMSGGWNLTIYSESEFDKMLGRGSLVVRADGDEPAEPEPLTMDMAEPTTENSFSPWGVLLAAIGLAVAAEATAVTCKLVRKRREHR